MIDPEAISGIGDSVAAVLTPPWNMIAAGAVGLVAGAINRKQQEKKP